MAIVTDGSELDIVHTNELIPRLESQASLFKLLYNIDCFPIILDPKLCTSAEDLLMALENLAPVYKVIDLRYVSQERVTQLLRMLHSKDLGITVLYSGIYIIGYIY